MTRWSPGLTFCWSGLQVQDDMRLSGMLGGVTPVMALYSHLWGCALPPDTDPCSGKRCNLKWQLLSWAVPSGSSQAGSWPMTNFWLTFEFTGIIFREKIWLPQFPALGSFPTPSTSMWEKHCSFVMLLNNCVVLFFCPCACFRYDTGPWAESREADTRHCLLMDSLPRTNTCNWHCHSVPASFHLHLNPNFCSMFYISEALPTATCSWHLRLGLRLSSP